MSSNLERLKKQIDSYNNKLNTTNSNDDERYWKAQVDKAGNGYAVIRFLPTPPVDGEDAYPWVREFSHGFKNEITGKWYIEKSLTTLNLPDPVAELNYKLWATGTDANKELVRKQKRKLTYISNVLVISDPANPENEGKIFLFKYGKKIFDKIKEAMEPPFPDREAFDPFDLATGANFKLKIRKFEGYQNYDLSGFDNPSKIKVDLTKLYSLQELVDPKNFKSYDQLKTQLERVLGNSVTPVGVTVSQGNPTKVQETDPKSNKVDVKIKEAAKKASASDDEDDDEKFLDNFLKNAKEKLDVE